MNQEISKYPYNAIQEHENKVFFSDLICERIVEIKYKNGQLFYVIKEKITSKKKKVVLSVATFIFCFGFKPDQAKPIGIPTIHQISRLSKTDNSIYESIYSNCHIPKINVRLNDTIFMTPSQLPMWFFITNEQFVQIPEVNRLLKQVRGGALLPPETLKSIITLLVFGAFWAVSLGFQISIPQPVPRPPHRHIPNNFYNSRPHLVRPSDCGISSTALSASGPTQSLKTWESRNEPNEKDRVFMVETRPELTMRRGQSKHKTKDHGALAGLDYNIKPNGTTSTLKTEGNVDIFMDVVEEIVYDPLTIWFEEGTYLEGPTNERGRDTINLYSEKHRRIIIFLKNPPVNEFFTFCEPTDEELVDLYKTGNFGKVDLEWLKEPKNVPPKHKFESQFADENTSKVETIPTSSSGTSINTNVPSAEGITPINTFENDVLGITPALDYQI